MCRRADAQCMCRRADAQCMCRRADTWYTAGRLIRISGARDHTTLVSIRSVKVEASSLLAQRMYGWGQPAIASSPCRRATVLDGHGRHGGAGKKCGVVYTEEAQSRGRHGEARQRAHEICMNGCNGPGGCCLHPLASLHTVPPSDDSGGRPRGCAFGCHCLPTRRSQPVGNMSDGRVQRRFGVKAGSLGAEAGSVPACSQAQRQGEPTRLHALGLCR
jgi:hypothetical protein